MKLVLILLLMFIALGVCPKIVAEKFGGGGVLDLMEGHPDGAPAGFANFSAPKRHLECLSSGFRPHRTHSWPLAARLIHSRADAASKCCASGTLSPTRSSL